MLNWTDRHCRFFLRLFSRQALLYTEMLSANTLLLSKNDHLVYNNEEHPISLQVGSREPKILARCAKLAEERGYDEINLNVGCPSNRMKKGFFGAYLMNEKEQVANCVSAMREAVNLPITVKTRIGIDENDSYSFLSEFVDTVSTKGGCKTFVIHARKAYLNGFSPKKNREIPPLNYERVYKLKQDFPSIRFVLNGGIVNLYDALQHLRKCDGVMIGREVYRNPSILMKVDSIFFGKLDPVTNRKEIFEKILPYIDNELSQGTSLNHITRHMLGLFQGLPGAGHWRRYLSEHAHRPGAGINILVQALSEQLLI
nr:tRNA dihydrouridine(20/20a) synthase DusA [secondary endosymbiont of Heteropsylla cubana]